MFLSPTCTHEQPARAVTARNDGVPSANQAAIANLAGVLLLPGGGGLI